MKQYRISMVQSTWDEATVYIEADNPEEAERIALERADKGEVVWRFLDANDPLEITSVDEVVLTLKQPEGTK